MRTIESTRAVLLYETIGFGIIIAVSWFDELISLPHLIWGVEHHPDYREAALETAVAILVAIPMLVITKRLVAHLHHLKGFLIVCAWCRRVEHDGRWLPIEQFFDQGFDVQTSHGMCADCLEKAQRDLSATGRGAA